MAISRADAARTELAGLARAGMDVESFCRASCAVVDRVIPSEYGCLATTDPTSGLITGTVKSDPGDSRDAEFAHHEYVSEDLNQFSEIARRVDPVGVLELDTAGRPELSARYREFLLPLFSHRHELRVAFRSAGEVWGVLGLYRSTGLRGFTPVEADFAASVSETIANGIRASLISASLIRAAPTTLAAAAGPAVIIVGADDIIQQMTPAAEQRVHDLGGFVFDSLPMTLLSIVGAARAPRAGSAAVPRARVRALTGQWFTVQAAPSSGPRATAGDVVMTIETAGPSDIVPLIVAAFGLTNREQDIVALVLQGADTAAISRRLHLSPYTVQDYLKSIFAKAGVSSRRELTAKVFFDQYAPRFGQPLGPTGFFTQEQP